MLPMDTRMAAARALKRALIASSPLIEEYTRETCPVCEDVCCRQKHGNYHERDIVYLTELGVPVPVRDPNRHPEGSCEALGEQGCVHPRWLRPFQCTWYFCDPLLSAMAESPQKKARALSAALKDMVRHYDDLKG